MFGKFAHIRTLQSMTSCQVNWHYDSEFLSLISFFLFFQSPNFINSSCDLISQETNNPIKNGQKIKQVLLQRRYTDGQEAHEKMFNITNYSIQFSRSVVSDYLQSYELQHTRPSCPSPTLRAYSNYVHRVSDAIKPSHPLSYPSSPAFNFPQHQGLSQ